MILPDEETLVARAVAAFKAGYNCSPSVALPFAECYEIPEALMVRFAASFGGGIGRMRQTCGAACAMFMLAGLEVQNAADQPEEQDFATNPYPSQALKKKNYEVVQRLAADFRTATGSTNCLELLRLSAANKRDLSDSPTPEARTDDYYRRRPCVRMVETAVRVYYRYLCEKYRQSQ